MEFINNFYLKNILFLLVISLLLCGVAVRELRKITPEDDIYYDKEKLIPQEIIDKYMK